MFLLLAVISEPASEGGRYSGAGRAASTSQASELASEGGRYIAAPAGHVVSTSQASSPQAAGPASEGGRYSAASPGQVASTSQASEDPKARLRDEIREVEEMLAKRPTWTSFDRGAALYLLAHHYARLGDSAKALKLLEECVALDAGFDPSDAPAFASLKQEAKFGALIAEVRRRYPPV